MKKIFNTLATSLILLSTASLSFAATQSNEVTFNISKQTVELELSMSLENEISLFEEADVTTELASLLENASLSNQASVYLTSLKSTFNRTEDTSELARTEAED